MKKLKTITVYWDAIKDVHENGKSILIDLGGTGTKFKHRQFYIPLKVIEKREKDGNKVHISVWQWWYDKNPEQLGGMHLHDIIQMNKERIWV